MSALAASHRPRHPDEAVPHTIHTFAHGHLRVRIARDEDAEERDPLLSVGGLCTMASYGPITADVALGNEQWGESFRPRLTCRRCDGTGADLTHDPAPRGRRRAHARAAHQAETGDICPACGGWGEGPASILEYVRELDAIIALPLLFSSDSRGYGVTVCEHPATEPNGVVYFTYAAFMRRYHAPTPKNRTAARRMLTRIVEEYDHWLRREVYGYVIETVAGYALDAAWGFATAAHDTRLLDAARHAAETCSKAITA